MAHRFSSHTDNDTPRKASPYASNNPQTSLDALLSYYFEHPTSDNTERGSEHLLGPYHDSDPSAFRKLA